MRSNVPRGRAAWARVVAGFEKTRLTQTEFCDAQGLNVGTFRSWLYRLRSEHEEDSQRGPTLVELVSVPERFDSACVVRIGASEIRFSERPAPEYLGALLRVAGER